MNLYSLPNAVREQLKAIQGSETVPKNISRANACLDGSSGEAYLVSYADRLLIFSRRIGQSEYDNIDLSYIGDISSMALRKEPYDFFLDMTARGENYSIQFANYLADTVKPIVDQWNQAINPPSEPAPASLPPPVPGKTPPQIPGRTVPPPPPPVPRPARHRKGPPPIPVGDAAVTPFEALLATLMYAATVDEEVHPNELRLITDISAAVQGSFEKAEQYYENHSVGEIFSIIADYDYQQKLCILSNIMELCMADGLLRSKEQAFIKNYCEFTGTPSEDSRRIYDVLLMKNQTSVLQHKAKQ